jgi:hypothetical protein
MRACLIVTRTLFALIALAHLTRMLTHASAVIGGWAAPLWLSASGSWRPAHSACRALNFPGTYAGRLGALTTRAAVRPAVAAAGRAHRRTPVRVGVQARGRS